MKGADIIIINWNTGKLLARCLDSLHDLPEQHEVHKIYVVDNNSSDNSFIEAKNAITGWDKIEFIQLPENMGFAAANNLALRKSMGDAHILLLNPDTEMQPGSLTALVSALERNPKIGIVGSKLLNSDHSLQPSVRMFPTFSVVAALFLKLHSTASSLGLLKNYFQHGFDYTKEQVVDQVMGACFLIRRQTLQEVGVLDEKFFVWFEEVDFCKRAISKGWGTLYTPSAAVIHYGGASFHQLIGFQKSFPMIKSALRYSRKHLGLVATLILFLLTPLALLLTLPAALVHIFKKRQNIKRL